MMEQTAMVTLHPAKAVLAPRAMVRPVLRRLAALAVGFAGGWAVLYGTLAPLGLGLALGAAEDCFAACAAALYLQLRYHAHLSRIEDVGAFLDTAQAAAFASAVLLCVTLALNALALCAAAVCARKAVDRA